MPCNVLKRQVVSFRLITGFLCVFGILVSSGRMQCAHRHLIYRKLLPGRGTCVDAIHAADWWKRLATADFPAVAAVFCEAAWLVCQGFARFELSATACCRIWTNYVRELLERSADMGAWTCTVAPPLRHIPECVSVQVHAL